MKIRLFNWMSNLAHLQTSLRHFTTLGKTYCGALRQDDTQVYLTATQLGILAAEQWHKVRTYVLFLLGFKNVSL